MSYVRLPVDRHGLQLEPLFSEPRVAVLPNLTTRWPARSRSACATWPMTICSSTRTPFRSGATRHRTAPAAPHHTTPVQPHRRGKAQNVASGRGIVILPETTAVYYRRADIAYVQLTDLPPAQTALAWSSTRRSPLITEFVEIATTRLACGGGR